MKTLKICAFSLIAVNLAGCASTYGNLVSGSNLGAAEYMPAVMPNPGMEGKYQQVLGICRQVAVNRQVTAAQEAQLRTITGVTAGTVDGAAFGAAMGSVFRQSGLNTSVGKDMALGSAVGLLTSLVDSFASGTEHDAAQTRQVLLTCLRKADPSEQFYKVMEG